MSDGVLASRIARPARPGEKQLRSIALERHADCLMFRLTLTDDTSFVLPATDQTVRELGQACLAATDRVLVATH